jgi:hypothetical protein
MAPFVHFKVARNRASPVPFRRDYGEGAAIVEFLGRPIIIESLVAEQRGAHNGRLSTPGPLPMVTAGNKRTTQPIAMPIATLR